MLEIRERLRQSDASATQSRLAMISQNYKPRHPQLLSLRPVRTRDSPSSSSSSSVL